MTPARAGLASLHAPEALPAHLQTPERRGHAFCRRTELCQTADLTNAQGAGGARSRPPQR